MLAQHTPRRAAPFLACRDIGYDPTTDALQYGWYQTGSANEGAKRAAPAAAAALVTWGMSGYASPIVSAVAGNAVQQGVAIATDQQEDFDWRQTVAAGVTAYLGQQAGFKTDFSVGNTWANVAQSFAQNYALGVIGGAIQGDSFSSGRTWGRIGLSAASSTASQWAAGMSQQAVRAQQLEAARAGMDHEYGIYNRNDDWAHQTQQQAHLDRAGFIDAGRDMMGQESLIWGKQADFANEALMQRSEDMRDRAMAGLAGLGANDQVAMLNQQAKAKSAGMTNAARSVTAGTAGTSVGYSNPYATGITSADLNALNTVMTGGKLTSGAASIPGAAPGQVAPAPVTSKFGSLLDRVEAAAARTRDNLVAALPVVGPDLYQQGWGAKLGFLDPFQGAVDAGRELQNGNYGPAGLTTLAAVLPFGKLAKVGDIVPINGATRTVPLGFESRAQFEMAAGELQAALRRSGIDDAVVGARGSSITGVTANPNSVNFGQPFRPDSDVDFFAQSQQLVDSFRKSPNFVHPDQVMRSYPELAAWSQRWIQILGRDISPAAWKPGALPKTPAITVQPR